MLLPPSLGCVSRSGVSAWYLLKRRETVFRAANVVDWMSGACILIALQVFVGDHVGSTMVKYQPAKLMAAEGLVGQADALADAISLDHRPGSGWAAQSFQMVLRTSAPSGLRNLDGTMPGLKTFRLTSSRGWSSSSTASS